jgi:hypothetical protein
MPGGEEPKLTVAPLGHLLYVLDPTVECGGASSNRTHWLIDMRGGQPRVVAEIAGWGLGVQRQVSHGLHDFVTGYHNSADDFTLNWWRFNGKVYRKIAANDVVDCKAGDSVLEHPCYTRGGRPLNSALRRK